MGGKRITQNNKLEILALRQKGHSYSEIRKKFNVSKSTLSLLLGKLKLENPAVELLLAKKYRSKAMAAKEWQDAKDWAKNKIGKLNDRDKLLIMAMLYWGEGTKRELNIINGDPAMLVVFISCLRNMGIKEEDITVALRIFDVNKKSEMVNFWAKILSINKASITRFEIIEGKKTAKLPYGMCRIRLRKSALYFKRIMSMISEVKELFSL